MEEARGENGAVGMAVVTEDGRQQDTADLSITTEQHEDGEWLLKLACVQPVLMLKPIAAILESLGLTIVSFGIDSSGNTGRGKRAFFSQGHFVVSDEEGAALDMATMKHVVSTLRRELHTHHLTSAGSLPKCDSTASLCTNQATPDTKLGRSGSESSVVTCSASTIPEGSNEAALNKQPAADYARTLSGQGSAGTGALSRDSSASGLAGIVGAGVLHQQPPSHQEDHSHTGGHGEDDRASIDRQRSRSGSHLPLHLLQPPPCTGPRSAVASLAPGTPFAADSSASLAELGQAPASEAAALGEERTPMADQGDQFLLSSPHPTARQPSSLLDDAMAQQISGSQGAGDGGTQGAASDGGAGGGPVSDEALGVVAVERIMSNPVRWIHKDADLSQAKTLMSTFHISALLVDTGGPPGFITKRDFLKVSFSRNLKRTRVRDVMTQPVISVPLGTHLKDAAALIEARGVRRVLVHDPALLDSPDPLAAYVGVVSDTDLLLVQGGGRRSAGPGAAAEGGGGSLRTSEPELPPGGSLGGEAPGTSASGSAAPSAMAPALTHTFSALSGISAAFSSLSEQARGISTEDRYRAAAALWELDFSEIDIGRKLGEGSFGEVLLGNFRGTKVAVKRMRGFEVPGGEDDPGPSPSVSPTMMPVFAQLFEREIEIMATIRHPNVVSFIGACHTPPNVCLVTEFCARGSLDHLLHKSGLHLDQAKKVEFAMDIARGMSCLHSQRPPIIHRDLKAANLLVSARFEVKVADFGLSRIKDQVHLINSRAGLEGTVEYCAPEVLRGEPFSEKCDIWSYGVVLWELFSRARPYADADVPIYILMMALGNGSLRLPPLKEETTSPGLVRLVERCLSWLPGDRPSFREILHTLEHIYKEVRGKAAAVPRSDSASSMVTGPHPARSESAAPGAQPHLPLGPRLLLPPARPPAPPSPTQATALGVATPSHSPRLPSGAHLHASPSHTSCEGTPPDNPVPQSPSACDLSSPVTWQESGEQQHQQHEGYYQRLGIQGAGGMSRFGQRAAAEAGDHAVIVLHPPQAQSGVVVQQLQHMQGASSSSRAGTPDLGSGPASREGSGEVETSCQPTLHAWSRHGHAQAAPPCTVAQQPPGQPQQATLQQPAEGDLVVGQRKARKAKSGRPPRGPSMARAQSQPLPPSGAWVREWEQQEEEEEEEEEGGGQGSLAQGPPAGGAVSGHHQAQSHVVHAGVASPERSSAPQIGHHAHSGALSPVSRLSHIPEGAPWSEPDMQEEPQHGSNDQQHQQAPIEAGLRPAPHPAVTSNHNHAPKPSVKAGSTFVSPFDNMDLPPFDDEAPSSPPAVEQESSHTVGTGATGHCICGGADHPGSSQGAAEPAQAQPTTTSTSISQPSGPTGRQPGQQRGPVPSSGQQAGPAKGKTGSFFSPFASLKGFDDGDDDDGEESADVTTEPCTAAPAPGQQASRCDAVSMSIAATPTPAAVPVVHKVTKVQAVSPFAAASGLGPGNAHDTVLPLDFDERSSPQQHRRRHQHPVTAGPEGHAANTSNASSSAGHEGDSATCPQVSWVRV